MEDQHKRNLMIIYNSHLYFFKKVACIVLIFCFSKLLFAEQTELKITENSFFEIVGSDLESNQFTNELSNYVAESILSDFYQEDYLPSRRILVQLLNAESIFNDNDFYDLNVSNLGFVTLNINWNESLDLALMIEALTVSFIQSFGYSSYGKMFLQKYPSKAWLLKGLSTSIYISLRPYVARLFYKQAMNEGLTEANLNAKFLDISVPSDSQAFGFYRYIKSKQISHKDRLRIIGNAIVGKDSLIAIYATINFDSERSLQNVLSDFLKSQYRNKLPRFEDLTASKNKLEVLGDFSSIEIQSNQIKLNSLNSLWLNRSDPSVVQLIEARIYLILYALNKINPLYFNAAQSLALVYQKILDANEEWELIYYFSDFLQEMDKANTVCIQISKKIQL